MIDALVRTGLEAALVATSELLEWGAEGHGWEGWRLLDDHRLLSHLTEHVEDLRSRGLGAIDHDSGRPVALHVAARALQVAVRALER